MDFIDFVKKFRWALILLARVLDYYRKIINRRSRQPTRIRVIFDEFAAAIPRTAGVPLQERGIQGPVVHM